MSSMIPFGKMRAWHIEIQDGMTTKFKIKIPENHITLDRLDQLLKMFVFKYALSDEETTHCFCRKNTKLGKMSNSYFSTLNKNFWVSDGKGASANYLVESSGIYASATLVEL